MLRWVNVVNRVLQAYKERAKAELEAKIASETPPRIRAYDDLGEEEFVTNIEIELAELYPTSEMEATLTLKEHLSCASEVVQYLVDFVPETQSVGADKITRYVYTRVDWCMCYYGLFAGCHTVTGCIRLVVRDSVCLMY
jgi:hypothetical protein